MKTKKTLLVFSIILFVTTSNLFADSAGDTIASGLGRGALNIVTSPAELPHHLIYDIDNKGAVGVLTGFGKGLVFTFSRIIAGFGDALTLGFVQKKQDLYGSLQMKTYVWDEDWKAPKDKTSPKDETKKTEEVKK